MNSPLLADSTLQLETFAKDFQHAVDRQIAAFNQEKELHKQTMAELNQRIDAIKATLNQLEEKHHKKEDNLKTSIEEIDAIQKEIDTLKLEETKLETEKQKVLEEFESKRRRMDEANEQAKSEEQDDKESKELSEGLLYYSQRLQLYFNRDEDGMRISFRCIDSKHPKRRFYVVLKVNESERWEIIRTKPELSSTESLAQSLNQSNDINTFLREIRKQFRKEFCDD
ncbi:hypothetical protein WA538_003093 [Blastocystis sp. DL]